jgi:hypothetical protein
VANEIEISMRMAFSKSSRSANTDDMNALGLTFTMSGTDYVKGTQTIGTTAEVLGKGEITTPGFLFIKNLDGTNYIELEKATFSTTAGTVKIKAGEVALFRVASSTIYACANTAACDVSYLMIED